MNKPTTYLIITMVAIMIATIVYWIIPKNYRLQHEELDIIPPDGNPLKVESLHMVNYFYTHFIKDNCLYIYPPMPSNELDSSILLPGEVISYVLDIDILHLICKVGNENELVIIENVGSKDNLHFEITKSFKTEISKLLIIGDTSNNNYTIIGVSDDRRTIIKNNSNGNVIDSKVLPEEYVFSEFPFFRGSEYFNGVSNNNVILLDAKTLESEIVYSLPNTVDINNIIPPGTYYEYFVIDNNYIEIYDSGTNVEYKGVECKPRLATVNFIISQDNDIIYNGSIVHSLHGYTLLDRLLYYDLHSNGFLAIDVFSKWNEITKQTEIILIQGYNDFEPLTRYYIIKVEPFNDKIKAVYDSSENGYLVYVGEKKIYKTLEPEWWKYTKKVEYVQ